MAHKVHGGRGWFPSRVALGLNLVTSLLVVMSAASVASFIPVERVAPLIGAIVLSVSGGLLWREIKSGKFACLKLVALAPIFLAVLTLLAPAWQEKAFVSLGHDAWAYSALGQYVLKHSRATGAGLSIVDQWAHGLKSTRFGTAGLLGLFACWFNTDTCRSTLPFAILVLAQLGSGFALFTRLAGASRLAAIGAGIYASLFGWVPEIVKFGNFDQLLFLSFLPFLLVRFRLLLNARSHSLGVLGFSFCLAAMAYCYPEGIALAAIVFLPLVAVNLAKYRRERRCYLRVIIGLLVGLVLLSPYWKTFWWFLRLQIGAASVAVTGKGLFNGLLGAGALPAFFALGEQLARSPLSLWNFILPAVLAVLFACGCIVWWKRSYFGLVLCLFPFGLLCAWQGLVMHYDYGLYKVITVGLILIIPAIFVGLNQCALALSEPKPLLGTLLGISFLLTGTLEQELSNRSFALFEVPVKTLRTYSGLENLRGVIGDRTLRVTCDSSFNQEWAVFFLRNCNIEVPVPIGYLSSVQGRKLLAKAKKPPAEASYTLSDCRSPGAAWQNSVFSIGKTDPVEICGVEWPKSMERIDNRPFLWLNNEATNIVVCSKRDCRATFSIGGFFRDRVAQTTPSERWS